MDDFSLEISVTPIDLLKCLTEVYKTNRYTEVELVKLAEASRRFDKEYLDKSKRYEIKKEKILERIEFCQKVIEELTIRVVENPSLASNYLGFIKIYMDTNINLIALLEKVD